MTPEIERLILGKAKVYRRCVKNGGNAHDRHSLLAITTQCKLAINSLSAKPLSEKSRFFGCVNSNFVTRILKIGLT